MTSIAASDGGRQVSLEQRLFEDGMQRFDMIGKVMPNEESSLPGMQLFVKRSNKSEVVRASEGRWLREVTCIPPDAHVVGRYQDAVS